MDMEGIREVFERPMTVYKSCIQLLGAYTKMKNLSKMTISPKVSQLESHRATNRAATKPTLIEKWDKEMAKYVAEAVEVPETHCITDSCVYTIIDGKELNRLFKTRGTCSFKEKKRWVTAESKWQKGRSENLNMPILFGDAAHCSHLLYWGLLTELEVRDGGTSFAVDHLRKISGRRETQDLALLSTGKNIAPGFIKPYAICYTPRFLKESKDI
jgi:hypothetical protein